MASESKLDRGIVLYLTLAAFADGLHVLCEHHKGEMMDKPLIEAVRDFRDRLTHAGELIRQEGNPDGGDDGELMRAFLALQIAHNAVGQCLSGAMSNFLVDAVPRVFRIER